MSVAKHVATLLATTAILAASAAAAPLVTHHAAAATAKFPASALTTLYDQSQTDSGTGIVSQNFESSFDQYDCEAADDFIVPDGVRWKIKEVDVVGTYFDGSGGARSVSVLFFKDKHGLPGKPKGAFDVVPRDQFGSFALRLKPGAMFKPGHYWVSVQSNQDFITAGEWGWEVATVQRNLPAVWRNPGGGFAVGCTDWAAETECIPQGGDHLFVLRGRVFELADRPSARMAGNEK